MNTYILIVAGLIIAAFAYWIWQIFGLLLEFKKMLENGDIYIKIKQEKQQQEYDNELRRSNKAIETTIEYLKYEYQKYFQPKTDADIIKAKEFSDKIAKMKEELDRKIKEPGGLDYKKKLK